MEITEIVDQVFNDSARQLSLFLLGLLALLCVYELVFGRYTDKKKTGMDWAMAGLALGFLAVVQRPLLAISIFFISGTIFPTLNGSLNWFEQQYFWPALVGYLLIDEYLHGRAHLFAHSKKVKNPIFRKIQAFYRISHRPHHQLGGNDGKGELTASHTYVEHWGWWLILPNYWFGLICLYLGLYELFLWGTLIKAAWGMHVHTNWGTSYDLYLLNHPIWLIRKIMFGLCHVFVFPNMHHHHHSRSVNSARNMTNFIAIYDWLLWGTQVIEKKRPKIYGWRQKPDEEYSALYRFFHTDMKRG